MSDAGQVRYTEALDYFLSADIKALKKGLKKSKPTHRLISCFMRMQKVLNTLHWPVTYWEACHA